MGHMKKYKCPVCVSTKYVVGFGRRGKRLRYWCKGCGRHFSVNPCFLNAKALLNDHLDGVSFRRLSVKYGISAMKAWRVCKEGLEKLPSNNQFTFNYCSRFSNIFVADGKYFNVAGFKQGYCLLWGIDYLRHDIPVVFVAPSESYQSWNRFFYYFRIINHYPELVVCDDNTNLKMAARRNFPSVRIQTCFNHFKENMRRTLKVRSDPTYKEFMSRVEDVLADKLSNQAMDKKLFALYRDYRQDSLAVSLLTNIEKSKPELTGYRGVPSSPLTTNIIEGFNSHLEARLTILRSFQSTEHARLWINGYVLKRRFTKFTDCKGKFKNLNGKTGVEMTKKPDIDLPILF